MPTLSDDADRRLALALDVPDVSTAARLVSETEGLVGVYKIGLELVMTGGLELARRLSAQGHAVFLDMKLLDIPNTVSAAVRNAGRLGVRYLTVHAYPQALTAAVTARPDGLAIAAVTVLTSLDAADLAATGYDASPQDLVKTRIAAAAEAGVDAVVCAPGEAPLAKAAGLAAITPGVRLDDDAAGDQKRTARPRDAIRGGASLLVVGRPITAAPDPRAAAERILEDIRAA